MMTRGSRSKLHFWVKMFLLFLQELVLGGVPHIADNAEVRLDRVTLYPVCEPPPAGSTPAVPIPSVPIHFVPTRYVSRRYTSFAPTRYAPKRLDETLHKYPTLTNHADWYNMCINSNMSKPINNFYEIFMKPPKSYFFKITQIFNGTSFDYFCTLFVGLTFILVYLVWKRTRTAKTKDNVKSPKTKIRITVAFKNLRRKMPSKIHFNAENSINYYNLLKNIRMRLKIKPTQSIYLFSNGQK